MGSGMEIKENSILLSVVVPCFNEQEVIRDFYSRLTSCLKNINASAEIIFIDDGSCDRTFNIIQELHHHDDRVVGISLNRNFGHQAAVTAGLQNCKGDAVIVIDADLQDPPEIIPEMIEKWQGGADVVYATRLKRPGESVFKLFTAALFYAILNYLSGTKIPLNTGDFRLMDRKIVDVLNSMRETHKFIRGMVSWIGGTQIPIYYNREPRLKGYSKYPFLKMLKFAIDAITSFSIKPLKIMSVTAIFIIAGACAGSLCLIIIKFVNPSIFIPGYPPIILAIAFFGGIQLFSIGVLGEYIGRIFEQSKTRPIYIIKEILK